MTVEGEQKCQNIREGHMGQENERISACMKMVNLSAIVDLSALSISVHESRIIFA